MFYVDDGFPEHPKLELLEADPMDHALACAAWLLLGCDSRRRTVNGIFTLARVGKVLPWPEKMRAKACAALVRCGLWHEVKDGYEFHDWAEYQDTREEIVARRRARSAAQRKWRNRHVTGASTSDAVDGPVDNLQNESQDGLVEAPVTTLSGMEWNGDQRSESDRVDWLTVAKAYKSRFESTYQADWQQFAEFRPALESVARWANAQAKRESKPGQAIVDRLLDGAFADAWMREHKAPPTSIAKQPAKYYGAVAAKQEPTDRDRLHAEHAAAKEAAHQAMLAGDTEAHQRAVALRNALAEKIRRLPRSAA